MAIIPVNVTPKESGGSGGLLGKIAGAALGLGATIAAPFSAGTSLALAAPAVAAPFIGNAIDPLKQTSGKSVSSLESYMKTDPEAQAAVLQEAMKSTVERPDIFASPADQKDALDKMGMAKNQLMEMASLRRKMGA